MPLDTRKHVIPDRTAQPLRSDFDGLSRSIRDPIPVASATERSQVLAALTTQGVSPSASNPVFFWRYDLPAPDRLQVTEDGTNFRTFLSGIAHGAWTHVAPFTTTGLDGEGFPMGTGSEWGLGVLQLLTSKSQNPPATISGEKLSISAAGIYAVSFTVRLKTAPPNQVDVTTPNRAYAQIHHEGDLTYRAIMTTDGMCTVAIPNLLVPAGGAVLNPTVYQSSGVNIRMFATVQITRMR